jgi:SAM-dependent methyltransferase
MGDITSYYDTYWSSAGYNPESSMDDRLQAIFAKHLPTTGTCLDVGCGRGAIGPWLTARGLEYQGVDVSANAVREAQAAGLNAIAIDDASHLPFADASFDAVLSIEVLEHLFLPLNALVEMRRVLKPDGVLIVTTPNVAYWRRRADLAVLGRWNPFGDDRGVAEPWRDPHIRFFNPASLRRCLVQAGFVRVAVGAHAGSYRWLMRVTPSLFGVRLHAVAHR